MFTSHVSLRGPARSAHQTLIYMDESLTRDHPSAQYKNRHIDRRVKRGNLDTVSLLISIRLSGPHGAC